MTKDTTKGTTVRYWLAGILGGVLALGLLGFFVIRSSIWVSPRSTQDSPPADSDITPSPPIEPISPASPVIPPSDSLPSQDAETPFTPQTSAFPPEAVPRGTLRVSNQTIHPVRIALLPQSTDPDINAQPLENPGASEMPAVLYGEPVHWDFAPEEGSTKGLLLSMPVGDLQLQGGDILTAFAQDGSRRYWGPYVVGKTAMPTWNSDTQEWQLVLQP
ncbi:MAG: hypothetical protein ACFE0I_08655 [Elainellaceae cyanobacterium]